MSCLEIVAQLPSPVVLPVRQDAARKALQEMFKGKEDALAAYDGGGSGKVPARAA